MMVSAMRMALLAAALCLQLCGGLAHAQRAATIAIDPALSKAMPEEIVIWMAYGTRMSNHLSESGRSAALRGRYEPGFDEELLAREAQVQVWRELQQSGKVGRSVYMDDLLRISAAGFMREYVWRYYRRPSWGEPPADLRTPEFAQWARDHLASHVPYTGVVLQYPPE